MKLQHRFAVSAEVHNVDLPAPHSQARLEAEEANLRNFVRAWYAQETAKLQAELDAEKASFRDFIEAWYAQEAAKLQHQLEAEKANLRNFIKALEDARETNGATHEISIGETGVDFRPEGTIDVLQGRLHMTQNELDAVRDYADLNNIPAGILFY